MAVKRNGSSDDEDGGLDSLLDTMTNVVGILVLVLIATQLSVKDVVDTVMAESQQNAEQMDQVLQQLEEKKREEEDLERILLAPDEIDENRTREELRRSKELLERRKKELQKKKKEQNEFAIKIKDDQQKAAQNEKIIADSKKKRQELQTLITASMDDKAKLEAMLSKTPISQRPADIEVSIPNPRPPPAGAKQLPILCSGNKLYPINVEYFRKRAEARAKEIIARNRIQKDPVQGYDPKKFAPIWNRLKDEDYMFDVEYFIIADRHLRLRLKPKPSRGGTDRQLINPRSQVRRLYLNNLDPTKYYARFFVLPDSYDIYVKTRRLFNDKNILSGWDPQNQDWEYVSWVGGVELGPPIERKPASGPRKPQNLID